MGVSKKYFLFFEPRSFHSGVSKIKKKKRLKFNEDIYAIISIVAFILVLSFALGTVTTTEAALNGINSPSGMASLDVNETEIINESIEPILLKNGTTWQLRKLRFKWEK